ncbi:glycerophosphoryl diester phosphodiesterase [Fusarium subglutinans]|uniref:Glycerophosphoryl diester phosphodiesterase n=1 Tax=Gibberella subglutinans TaxID=42677 RepID=A0A8H5US98_GIBSU|nr:glycerophosphoryl diester phosphodiesterase [Fusarium subglutinans]KAF5597227.1 glycerophosphoryl diester phosphodiesterase [Fusarium subglutinans]
MEAERQSLIKNSAQPGPVPQAPWAAARPSPRDPSRRLPQAIAHRGAKLDWPENTMAAFRGAVKAGAHAIETDIHISADGVAVISHDASLKRCFGIEARIGECSWEYLSTLRTVAEPHEPMPRLKDFLQWHLCHGINVLFWDAGIRLDDVAADMLEQASFLQAARSQLPTYPLAHISISLLYSHHFLRVPNLGFNLNHKTLIGPSGRLFLRELRKTDKLLMTWTVNEPRHMEWCIRQNLCHPRRRNEKTERPALIDGVITDNPRLYLEICEKFENEMDGKLARPKLALTERIRKKAEMVAVVILTETLMMAYHVLRRMQGKFDFLRDRQSLDK